MAPTLLGPDYAEPGAYTQTTYDPPQEPVSVPAVVVLYVGTGQETLTQNNLPVARGSSATADERIPSEDTTGRAVLAVNPDGSYNLGAWDGLTNRFRVRHLPMTTGDGTGTPATDSASVSVTLNGSPVVVLSVDGEAGVVEISEYPTASDEVLCTYYFDRTDTEATDDVSAQVTAAAAVLDGNQGQNFLFTLGVTDRFIFSADGLVPATVTLPSGAAVTAAVVAAAINATAGIGSASASTFVNNLGMTCLRITADISLSIGSGSANGVLGFTAGASTSRNRTFYVFNGPLVTGSGGGVTTTRPTDVQVLVNGVEVAAVAVDGRTRAVTLPYAPAAGSTVRVRYFHNTWQDTFDYLAHTGVRSITRAAITPESSGAGVYVQGVDYVLKDDVVVWGAAAMVSAGVHTEGAETLGPAQVSLMLVDHRLYMAPCTAAVTGTGASAVSSTRTFRLPVQPVTGDGRANPLGAADYLAVSNGRSELPTSNPGLVAVYWGWSVADALARGPVQVTQVDPETSTVTLASPVPEGASVYASCYYSVLQDAAFIGSGRGYTLTCTVAGPAGTGLYSLTDGQGRSLYAATLAAKGAALSTVTVVFPSGSEFLPDLRIEGGAPVEETVTVQFESSDESPARYTAPGAGPYFLVAGASSALRLTVDGSAASTGGAAGINLSVPSGGTRAGAFASLVGGEIKYDPELNDNKFVLATGVNDTVSLLVDGVSLTATAGASGSATASNYVAAINTAADSEPTLYTAAGVFDNGYTVTVNQYDQLSYTYTGNVTGSSGVQTVTLTPGVYATAAELAAELQTQLAGGPVNCEATSDSRLRFLITKNAFDAAGTVEFITGSTIRDFAVIAGIDTGAAAGDNQVKIYHGTVALRYTVAPTSGRLPYDRIVVRNRLMPGAGTLSPFQAMEQCDLVVQGGNGAAQAGLAPGSYGEAAYRGCQLGPQLQGRVGWSGGIVAAGTFSDERDGQPAVVFYDGSDAAYPANNVLKISFGETLVTVVFTASGSGTTTALGPVSIAGSVLGQIAAELAGVAGSPTAVQEGDSFRIWGTDAAAVSPSVLWTVGEGSANDLLGLSGGASSAPLPVTARQLASALMAHVQVYANWVRDPSATGSGYFASRALAGVQTSPEGVDYLYFQSRTLGTASSLLFGTAVAADALRTGTGLGIRTSDFTRGRAAVTGFYVTSSDPAKGSGSANTSVLNSGTGQDGEIGQTYIDSVTGLRFTILPRAGGLAYPVGAGASLTFRVARSFVTDANIPTLAIPGVEMTVANLSGVAPADTARVETYSRAGAEPAIGETYYVSYVYEKADYSPRLFTRIGDVTAEYGPATPDNPLSLAADLAFKNGSSMVGTLQVRRMTGSNAASESSYINAVNASAGGCLPGEVSPGVLVLLTPATATLARHVSLHCDVQSSIRHRAERTAIFGFASGTRPDQLSRIVRAAGSRRVRFVYPEIATIQVTDVLNRVRNYLVDGRYLAGAVAASTTASSVDVATPWESRTLYGIASLGRRLDPAVANAVAQMGVTVLTSRPGAAGLRIRHGLTSDYSNILTRIPTVTQTADEIQRRARAVMDPYVGQKMMPHMLGQIEGRLNEMFKQAVRDQIISAYRNVSVKIDPQDPTATLAEGWWAPVMPALFLQLSLRVTATSLE